MTSAGAERVIANVQEAWDSFQRALERLNDADLQRPTPAGWTAKELISHTAFWAEAVEGYVVSALRLQQLPEDWQFGSGYVPDPNKPWPHFEEHNSREAAWARGQSAEAVRQRLGRAHAALVRFLTTVTDEEVTANEQYFADIAGHYREHTPELEAMNPEA